MLGGFIHLRRALPVKPLDTSPPPLSVPVIVIRRLNPLLILLQLLQIQGVYSGSSTAASLSKQQKKNRALRAWKAARLAAAATEAPSSSTTPIPTVSTTDSMEIKSSTNTDPPVYFLFLLTTDQAMVLSGYTYAQWMVHVNKVRDGYPNPSPEIDNFL